MKKAISTLAVLALALGLLAGCGTGASSVAEEPVESTPVETPASEPEAVEPDPEQPQIQEPEPVEREGDVYRGKVVALLEDGGIEVEQQYGYNYGSGRILFHIDEDTVVEEGGFTLEEGVFVEITYNGVLTRSEPPQGTADTITILAGFAEGVIVNGAITSVTETDDGYTLTLKQFEVPVPLGGQDDTTIAEIEPEVEEGIVPEDMPKVVFESDNTVVVHVAPDALEHLTPEELIEGTEVSVVTFGIMAMSMPPQVSAHALLPFAP